MFKQYWLRPQCVCINKVIHKLQSIKYIFLPNVAVLNMPCSSLSHIPTFAFLNSASMLFILVYFWNIAVFIFIILVWMLSSSFWTPVLVLCIPLMKQGLYWNYLGWYHEIFSPCDHYLTSIDSIAMMKFPSSAKNLANTDMVLYSKRRVRANG